MSPHIPRSRDGYRYPHFDRGLLVEDMAFHFGPRPGEAMPNFELQTTHGDVIRQADFLGDRPLLLTFGSVTDPMTAAARNILKRLHRQFGDRIAFVTLYVREAHPGDHFPQPDSLDRKLAHARHYQHRDQIPWTVAVDDLEGNLHRKLDPKRNAAYVMTVDGKVAYRTLWSNDEWALRKGLEAVADNPHAIVGEHHSRVVPMLSGMGTMYEITGSAGPDARRDLRWQLPSMYLMARIASFLRPLPPLARGLTVAVGVATATAAIGWKLRRWMND